MQTIRRHRRFAAGTLIVAMLLGACTGSDTSTPPSDALHDFDPAQAATKLRDLGRIDTRGEVRYGQGSGPVSARIGYDPFRYVVRSAIPVARTDASVEFVGIGDRGWVKRAALGATDELTVSGPLSLVMLRPPDARPYLELPDPNDPSSWSVTAAFDPARVLDAAAAAQVSFEPAGSRTIGGTELTGLRADLSQGSEAATGLRGVTVWVDGNDLPRHIEVATRTYGELAYDIERSARRLDVAPPDPASVEDPNIALPDATEPYTPVIETVAAGIPITVASAPAAQGWSCWKVESDPPFRGLNDTRPSGGTCVLPPQPDDPPDEQYAIPITSAASMPYTLIGLLFPPGSQVEFRRFGAEPVAATTDATGLALYAGPLDPVVGLAVVTTPEAEIVCGPAGVDNEAGFAARQIGGADNTDLVGTPWNCLGAADARNLSG